MPVVRGDAPLPGLPARRSAAQRALAADVRRQTEATSAGLRACLPAHLAQGWWLGALTVALWLRASQRGKLRKFGIDTLFILSAGRGPGS